MTIQTTDGMATEGISSVPLSFVVPDMMCGSCAGKIVAAVNVLDDGAVVVTNPETKLVQVTTVESWASVAAAIEAVGFEVAV